MELDLLAAAETESDSESNHSNQDNASGRRSVVTAATAGSEAGNVFSSAIILKLRPLYCNALKTVWLQVGLFSKHLIGSYILPTAKGMPHPEISSAYHF